tara:strand:- start:1196 stop:1651 length:456 start_codon:yes stop_codon:yes gene_type:complete
MSFYPTILFTIILNNVKKKNHIVLNNIIKFYKLNYNIKIIYLDNEYNNFINSLPITNRMLTITKSFFTNMFNLYNININKIDIYNQSDIHNSSKWKQEYDKICNIHLNYNKLCLITDIKTLGVECLLVDKIDDTNVFLADKVSRIEYEIII